MISGVGTVAAVAALAATLFRPYINIHKAGQTKFTVYRHNIFYFACGRVVIIQISNEHIGPCVILGVFDLESDMGVKRAADVTYIHVVTNNRHRLSFPTSGYIFHDRRDKTHCMGDPILYLPTGFVTFTTPDAPHVI